MKIRVFFSVFALAMSLTVANKVIADEQPVVISQTGGQGGDHNEGTTPPVVTFDDETGILEVEVTPSQVSVAVTVENDQGMTEVETVALAPGAAIPLPIDGSSTSYTVTLETPAGDVYEGTITL